MPEHLRLRQSPDVLMGDDPAAKLPGALGNWPADLCVSLVALEK
jgi:hypothetical protein